MGIANSMKALTQNIQASSEERAEELNKMKEETSILRQDAVDMVKDFSISRLETSRQLRRELAQSNTDRRKGVMQSRENIRSLMQSFQDSRRESGDQLRKELAQGSKLLGQNEKKRKQQVEKMLDAFQNSREEASAELKIDLVEGKAKMQSDIKKTLADTETLINSYQSSRRTMGTELKDGLSRDSDERKAEVEGMRNGFRKTQTELKDDLKIASDIWGEMGSVIHKKTSGSKAASKVQPEMPTEITPNLEEKLFSIINQHKKGITLSEVAKKLGLVTIVLGKAAKSLMEQGKIRKEEKIYFSITK